MPQNTTVAANVLGLKDHARLTQLEDVIATSRRWAIEEAKALRTIRDQRLYRATHPTFETYVEERWDIERAHAYRLCSWAEVIETVSPIGDVPQRETHARPLYGLMPEQQRDCWRAVCRTSATPTASLVSEVVEAHLRGKTQPKAEQAPQRANGTVVHADARDGLATLRDGSVDLLLFSPPYAEQRKRDYPSVPEREFPGWMTSVFAAARPKLAPRGNILWVAREHVRGGVISDYLLRTRLALREVGWHEIDVIIWSKPDAPPTGRTDRPRRAYESVYWFAATTDPYLDPKACGTPIEERREAMDRHRSIKGGHHGTQPYMKVGGEAVARVTDVVTAAVGTSSEGIDHPATYPLTLCDQLIRTYSPAGGLVADVCCGSGTTLVAARDAGRNWYGCDIQQAYVRSARRRLS
jgi:DNA modification methylase